jgi:hypothetical protein
MQSTYFIRNLITISILLTSGFCIAQDGQEFQVQLVVEGCQFTGGTDGMGNVEVRKNSGSKKIQIEVLNAEGYSIAPIEFSGMGAEQMDATGGGNSNKFNIHNKNDGPADVYWGINLTRIITGETVSCDPRIINN